jgi:anaerobic magnesium-protoporphyrin IX monomethyl ester cyclase
MTMKVALIGAELEENLGLRYMGSALEQKGHQPRIIPFNADRESQKTVEDVLAFNPDIAGLSMVFTGRAREFCRFASTLREKGYRGRIIAGGHFACLNSKQLLTDFPAFDAVALGEGEDIICALADHAGQLEQIPGICFRKPDGSIQKNRSSGNPENLDALPFPMRTTFHDYFGKPIASVLTSRGCWRNCAFCSINAWYKQGGGKKFRVRSIENIVAEMKELYFTHNIRIFNMQDDNFFLPNKTKALKRFEDFRSALEREGIRDIAIAVKARPDSITRETVRVLDDLGLFRVFLGVENASERALKNLNRKCDVEDILQALRILNDFDVHIAYNLLMFELYTTLEDIRINLRFIERHMDNPFNFCRAEAYAGTGLETTLKIENRLLGDYFGIDYRLMDADAEAFHQIANYAFFDRNFSDSGLHYFNMQVDFYFQLLRRFHPKLLSMSLRAAVRNFIKLTNLDTYESLCRIYDFVTAVNPYDQAAIHDFSRYMRRRVDERSDALRAQGENILEWISALYENRDSKGSAASLPKAGAMSHLFNSQPEPYFGLNSLTQSNAQQGLSDMDLLGLANVPVPYDVFKRQMSS